jgi:hypothetical protein
MRRQEELQSTEWSAENNVILRTHTICTEPQTEISTARKREHETVSESILID